MERFRPNVVVDGDLEAFVEDTWGTVRLGEVKAFGKRQMAAADWARGLHQPDGTILGDR